MNEEGIAHPIGRFCALHPDHHGAGQKLCRQFAPFTPFTAPTVTPPFIPAQRKQHHVTP
jgi:hypothetical protein